MLCVTASALESLACNVANVSPSYVILALMDARRSQFYNAFFRPGSDGMPERVTPDALLTFDEIVAEIDELFAGKEIMLVGDGAELFYGLYEKSGKGTQKLRFAVLTICIKTLSPWHDVRLKAILTIRLKLRKTTRRRN